MQTLEQLNSGQLAGTTKLKLSCGLTEFPKEILALAETLEYLDLTGNKLSALPKDFGNFKKLKIAFFSDNEFTEFPKVLAECPELEMVGFKANKLSSVPENSLPVNLRWLILTNNQIEEIPKSIGNCLRMQKLMLAGNKLTTLPSEMAACRNLELLRISANKISELPAWLLSLPRLSWLAFAGNPCSTPPRTNVNLPRISWPDLELEEQLGEGASGIISKAKSQTQEETKTVAVKVFKGEVTSDGLPADEMLACSLAGEHPNLVKVLGEISDHPKQKQGLVLELIPSGFKNLGNPPSFQTCTRDTYPEGTVFTLKEVLNIVRGIASALTLLHEQGIMHGDLYAHNILVNKAAKPLLGDFGAATVFNKNNKPLAMALQLLEIRAFGCLLEDLLNFVEPNNTDHKILEQLNKLKWECVNENPAKRPDFNTIKSRLKELTFLILK
jgi:hypothetical protein